MAKVFTHMTMSLDGFIADPNDQVGELFDWYGAGDVTVPTPNEGISFQVDHASAEMLRELTGNVGALVFGRHLFDIADGWVTTTRQALPSSWSLIAHPRTPPRGGRERRSSMALKPRSPRPDRSPATRMSPSRARRSLSRHSTSAWWTRCVSASCRCCSARGSRTSRSWTGATNSSTTRSSSRDGVPFTCDTRSDVSPRPASVGSRLLRSLHRLP